VRRHLLDLVVLFVLATGIGGFMILAQPGLRGPAVHVYVLVVGALLMLGLLAATGDQVPRRLRSELDAALTVPKAGTKPPPEVVRLQREVTLATASAYDLHARLLPQLRQIAEARLALSGRRPSEQTLGRWWELLRPDRPAPEDRFSKGIEEAELRALVADLARM
jgi:hypothetical protein